MQRCTCGILQHCKQKIHLKESGFGVLSHKFFLIAVAGTSCLCAFCSAAHWDYRRRGLAAGDAGKCCFLGVCSPSHQVLLRVGLQDKIYKILHFLLFLSSLSLACECISPYCKDFHRHQARIGGVSQPQITSSDLFISFSPAACPLPFPVFFYSLVSPFQLFFSEDVLPINLQAICYCTAKDLMHSPFSIFFLFSPQNNIPH